MASAMVIDMGTPSRTQSGTFGHGSFKPSIPQPVVWGGGVCSFLADGIELAGILLWPQEGRAASLPHLVNGHAAGLDRARPFFDFAPRKLRKIFWGGAVVGDDLGAELPQAMADRARLDCLHGSLVELLHDVRGCAFGQEECVPGRLRWLQ